MVAAQLRLGRNAPRTTRDLIGGPNKVERAFVLPHAREYLSAMLHRRQPLRKPAACA